MTSRSVLRVFRPLVVALTGLVLALPLLGLDCEVACARSDTDRGPVSNHCAALDSAPAGSSQAPPRRMRTPRAFSGPQQASEGRSDASGCRRSPCAARPAARAGRGTGQSVPPSRRVRSLRFGQRLSRTSSASKTLLQVPLAGTAKEAACVFLPGFQQEKERWISISSRAHFLFALRRWRQGVDDVDTHDRNLFNRT